MLFSITRFFNLADTLGQSVPIRVGDFMDQLVLRNNDVICISCKVISLIIIYITGEFLASQATKLTGSRQLRKLSGRKSIGNMGGRGSSMARGSRYGGRGSSMARGSFMVNMGIAEEAEDENNEEFEGMVSSLCSNPHIPNIDALTHSF